MAISLILNTLSKTRIFIRNQLDKVWERKTIDEETLLEIEAMLVQTDMGIKTSCVIIDEIRKKNPKNKEEMISITKDMLLLGLQNNIGIKKLYRNENGPTVILTLGVNGTGKTTTIAKLAYMLKREGKKVLLAAGDTFRAAAIEQLEHWANKVGVEVIKHLYKADPSAVVFDAIKAAINRSVDYLIIDTAGRFHTKTELMDELKKINKTLDKNYPGAPHEKILILDANTGQNGLIQARQFHEALGLSGIIVTKIDGTAKGGIIINICNELNIPIKFIGTGQELNDLEEFDPKSYVEAIL
jgi:fused signal recognition particle receptor